MPVEKDHILKSAIGGNGIDIDPTVAQAEGVNYIIAIGIDKYKLDKLNLESCVTDCEGLTKLLVNKYKRFQLYKRLYNEEANKQNIIDTIKDFYKNKALNNPLNSLIIFYSGHGGFVDTPRRNYGSWVPYDFVNDKAEQFIRLDDFLKLTEYIETRHLLIISDACFSGDIFEYNDWFEGSDNPLTATDIGLEPSRWALTSGRKNELAAAGKGKNNSAFTQALIQILDQKIDSRLLFSQIVGELRNKFSNNIIQKVDSGRLNISLQNSGEFIFEGVNKVLETFKKTTILSNILMSLNYDAQRLRFEDFATKNKKQFVFVTGTPNCGLYHLVHLAKNDTDFPENLNNTRPVSLLNDISTDDGAIMQLFNAALQARFSDLASLSNQILEILKSKSIVFEFRFYRDNPIEADGYLTTKQKQKILEMLALFVNGLNEAYQNDNKLIVFVVDEDCCDYAEIYKSNLINGVNAICMPRVSMLNQEEAKRWYNSVRTGLINEKDKLKEFDTFFKEKLYQNFVSLIDETKGYAGSTIRKICTTVQCDALAEQILSSNN